MQQTWYDRLMRVHVPQVKPRSTAIGRHPIICQSVPINDDSSGADCNGAPGTQAYAASGIQSDQSERAMWGLQTHQDVHGGSAE